MIISTSYGRFIHSKIQIYDLKEKKLIKEIKTKHMMEEIIIDDDKLVTIYEANAKKYKYSNNNKDIIISDMNKILTKN